MPGSGKTTIGRAAAAMLGCGFVDADDVIVARTGRPIAEMFATDGEEAFRAIESETLTDLLHRDGVVSLGGGAVLADENRRQLGPCRVAWLRAGVDTLVGRLTDGEAAGRPLLAGDVSQRLAALDRDRRALYDEVATIVVDVDDREPESVVAEVLASLRLDPSLR